MKWWRVLSRRRADGPVRVDPLGPMFISYRRSDGLGLAIEHAWALRSNGVPVWHDIADIPPGETRGRLREAIAGGLSGTVLVATPELKKSVIVRTVELPDLLRLEQADRGFIFAVANTITLEDGDLDYEAPDRLLRQQPDILRRLKQYAVETPDEQNKLAHEMALQRMAIVRTTGTKTFALDVQTRATPRAMTPHHALVFRTRPPTDGQRLPPAEIWPTVKDFMANLPKLIAEAGATNVQVRGGAHLSVAFAIGAALPETSAWPVTAIDQTGGIWASNAGGEVAAPMSWDARHPGEHGPVAVYVDLVPTSAPNTAFDDHIATLHPSATLHVYSRERLDPAAARRTTEALADGIREAAAQASTNKVALFLRCPFAIAVLLGRLLNTLEIELFELDDAGDEPHYARVAVVASGRGGSPIINITADNPSGVTP